MEITNSIIKWVYSLSQKKNRVKESCFVVEGTKCVLDTIGHFDLKYLLCTSDWAAKHDVCAGKRILVSRAQIERMSSLKTVSDVIAVYYMPVYDREPEFKGNLTILIDGVQDPGNIGTIIRIADWFGIRTIVCSENTVDIYNPKSIQATMGALSRVRVMYCNLSNFLESHRNMPVYGTFLDGNDIYSEDLSADGFIVVGNEGNGISHDLEKYMTKRLLIPPYPQGVETSESLNVGMATAIVVGEFRRRVM